MDEIAVINASPLIFLTRADLLELLTKSARQLLVPQPVADEILRRGKKDVTAQALRSPGRFQIQAVQSVPLSIAQWGLGAGESAVLALAQSVPGAVVVLDDLAGRKCASTFGLPLRGTLGLVLNAKRQGIVPLARPLLETLIRNGMYLSRPVLDEALRRVGE